MLLGVKCSSHVLVRIVEELKLFGCLVVGESSFFSFMYIRVVHSAELSELYFRLSLACGP